jgi:NAD/NADP transhydrogenase alpha subunit
MFSPPKAHFLIWGPYGHRPGGYAKEMSKEFIEAEMVTWADQK